VDFFADLRLAGAAASAPVDVDETSDALIDLVDLIESFESFAIAAVAESPGAAFFLVVKVAPPQA
jgi:hypothetical protein